MTRHGTLAQPLKSGAAVTLISLLATGTAGIAIGGPLWGFLGAAVLLFCVGWPCYLMHYDHGTEEIERYYRPLEKVHARWRHTTRAAVLWRTRPFVLVPLKEAESVPQ